MQITIEATGQSVFAISHEYFKVHFFNSEAKELNLDLAPAKLVLTALDELIYDFEGLWRHFKGGLYLFLGVAIDLADNSQHVLYCPTDNVNKIWARPLQDFVGQIEDIKRFTKLETSNAI